MILAQRNWGKLDGDCDPFWAGEEGIAAKVLTKSETLLIPKVHTRREPAKESYPPRPSDEDRRSVRGSAARAELRSVRRCRSPQAGCCLFRCACSIGQPKPAASGNRRKVALVRGGLGMIRPAPRPGPGRGAGKGAGPPSVHGALQPMRFPPHWVQIPGD
ncbi:hypothetical protein PAL_GLEAN10021343 [Pteropus alecto]|uniref:Uncharacterized protein n=1 Tax=Pteropus alecto TaxID=9402 RepID=L5KB03_PTEAL|nr:hypothetical protein PAL_GLEAN10021343 [Pteropus alecto]